MEPMYPEDAQLMIEFLEETYEAENQMLQAVSLGQVQKAESFIHEPSLKNLQNRVTSPIRNVKNYSIILNTLLRKAAENGGVHPLHIDQLSSIYAKKIEALTSPDSMIKLHREMVRKYALLVKNHSLKTYSILVRKVLTNIDADLTADLSLKAQASLLSVNASYLSTLFKKETGVTLTEFVNRKRIEHAIMLLNTTRMQIQDIAHHCGITDVNYFTKLFKKYVSKTPQQYRGQLTNKMEETR